MDFDSEALAQDIKDRVSELKEMMEEIRTLRTLTHFLEAIEHSQWD